VSKYKIYIWKNFKKGVDMKIFLRCINDFLWVFVTLMLCSKSLLAWNISLPDQDKFAPDRDGEICVSYADGGIGYVEKYNSCGRDQCKVLFPPPKEKYEEALRARCKSDRSPYAPATADNFIKCQRPWGGGAPVQEYELFRGFSSKANTYIKKIHEVDKRCPNFEEYQEIKKLVSLDNLALDDYIEKNKRESNERQAQFSKNMSLACKGRPELNVNYYEAMARKFGTNPDSIKFQRAVFDGSCKLTFYYPAGVITCNLSNTDSVNGKLQFNVSNSCSN
jgi:hypothetical protein